MESISGSPVFQIIPPTTLVLGRTFFIRNRQCGTAVIVEYKQRSYLITANHLITEPFNNELYLKNKEGWYIWHGLKLIARDEKLDVAVFDFPYLNNTEKNTFLLDDSGLHIGQHVHFLGFPLMMEEYIELEHLDQKPMPFQRGAIVSMITSSKLILDGINNVGFSGGPVVFYKNGKHFLCGIISGYKEELKVVEMADEYFQNELDAIYKENTGITYACPANKIKDLIDKQI